MKLLIVDDEVIIRTGLSTVINWAELGIELLPAAASAEEALARFPSERPDIVLTDIRMTDMDGLELAREIKRFARDVEICILTGHDEFTYAQQALREGISDYLLKTSRPEEIIQAVMKAKQRIETMREQKKQENLRQTALGRRLLEQLVTEGALEDRFLPQIHTLFEGGEQTSGQESIYQVLIVGASGWPEHTAAYHLLPYAVDNILNELLDGVSFLQQDRVVAIQTSKHPHDGKFGMQPLLSRVEEILKCSVFAAAGSFVNSCRELGLSYREADSVYLFRPLLPERGVYSYADVKDRKGGRMVCSQEEEGELSSLLLSGNAAELRLWVNRIVSGQLQDPEQTPSTLQAFLQSLLIAGHRWLERVLSDTGRVGTDIPGDLAMQVLLKDGESFEEALFKQLHTLISVYHQSIAESRHANIRRAIAFMTENLDKSITMQQVAKTVHLNPNHFSEVFKRETGMNYIEYLTKVRMKRAGEILLESPAKVSDVAKRVGYEDIKYFTQLFKKHTGHTPSGYRQANQLSPDS